MSKTALARALTIGDLRLLGVDLFRGRGELGQHGHIDIAIGDDERVDEIGHERAEPPSGWDGGVRSTPFAGTNRIRFRGSAAEPHSQRHEGAPLSHMQLPSESYTAGTSGAMA